MQVLLKLDKLARWFSARVAPCRNHLYPINDLAVEITIGTHCIVKPRSTLNQTWQNVINVSKWKSIIHAIELHGTLWPSNITVPLFAPVIAFLAKQDRFAVIAARHQHENAVWLIKPGEVVKVTILAKTILDVAVSEPRCCSRHDRNAVFLHQRRQLPPTLDELSKLNLFARQPLL